MAGLKVRRMSRVADVAPGAVGCYVRQHLRIDHPVLSQVNQLGRAQFLCAIDSAAAQIRANGGQVMLARDMEEVTSQQARGGRVAR